MDPAYQCVKRDSRNRPSCPVLLFCYFHAKFIDEIGIRVYNISLYFVFKKHYIFNSIKIIKNTKILGINTRNTENINPNQDKVITGQRTGDH